MKQIVDQTHNMNHDLISEGAASNETMYFVLNGSCAVYKRKGDTPVLINQLKAGD